MAIRATSNGIATGNELGSAVLDTSTINGWPPSIYSINLQIPLAASTQYALELSGITGNTSNAIGIRGHYPSSYSGGTMLINNELWPSNDLYFEIYGTSPCTDSDGLNYLTIGEVTSLEGHQTDYCDADNGGVLREWYCNGEVFDAQLIDCASQLGAGYSCSNGACVTSYNYDSFLSDKSSYIAGTLGLSQLITNANQWVNS